ncbi:MAG: LamG-like jellyroll fold domain-containing protein [Actinomycetota bacterium]
MNAKPLYIGKRADTSNADGLIDEVAIYNAPLSPTQISDHYAARVTPAGYKAAVLLDAPVAYYELNDAPRLKNEANTSAEGTYIAYNNSTLGHAGAGGTFGDGDTAAAFSGNARGEVDGSNLYVNQPGDFTVEAWAKPAAVSSGARTIVSKGAVGSHGGNYWLFTYGNDFHFWYRTKVEGCASSCTLANNIISWPSSKNAVVGEWYHVVAVFHKCDFPATQCSAKLYVNGVLEDSKSTRNASGDFLVPVTNSSPFRIGLAGASSGVYSFGGGTIDEVAVYGTVLTEAQINRHYAARQ